MGAWRDVGAVADKPPTIRYERAMKTLYLVRHAQSQPTDALPNSQWPLSERGRTQAGRLAELLSALSIDEIHTSPFLRCRDTIAPFMATRPVPLFEDHGLRERTVALRIIDNFPEVWRRSWEDFDFALPGCETSHSTQQRMHAAVISICERTRAETLAINSHGYAISLLLNRADENFHVEQATAMRNPDVYRMTFHEGALSWDATWRAPQLDNFATHHSETPFPPRESDA